MLRFLDRAKRARKLKEWKTKEKIKRRILRRQKKREARLARREAKPDKDKGSIKNNFEESSCRISLGSIFPFIDNKLEKFTDGNDDEDDVGEDDAEEAYGDVSNAAAWDGGLWPSVSSVMSMKGLR